MIVRLGNTSVMEGYREPASPATAVAELRAEAKALGVDADGTKDELVARLSDHVRLRPVDGQRVTTISIPADRPFAEALAEITAAKGAWAYHSDAAPAWVECDDEVMAGVLARHFDCPIGAPDDVELTYHTESGPPGVGPDGPAGGDA